MVNLEYTKHYNTYVIMSDTTGVYDIVKASSLEEAGEIAHIKFSPDNWRITSYNNFIKYNYKYNYLIHKWQKQADIQPEFGKKHKKNDKKRREINHK